MVLRNFLIVLLTVIALLTGSLHGSQAAQRLTGPHFTDIFVTTSESHLLLFGELQNSLTDEMVEGLHSGIPITFSFFVELQKSVDNWPDQELANLSFTHSLSYDTLKDEYLIEIQESSKRNYTAPSISEATSLLNEINGLKILELTSLEPDRTYRLRIKAELHKKTLPLKLHAIIPFVSWWDFDTDWYTVEFIY